MLYSNETYSTVYGEIDNLTIRKYKAEIDHHPLCEYKYYLTVVPYSTSIDCLISAFNQCLIIYCRYQKTKGIHIIPYISVGDSETNNRPHLHIILLCTHPLQSRKFLKILNKSSLRGRIVDGFHLTEYDSAKPGVYYNIMKHIPHQSVPICTHKNGCSRTKCWFRDQHTEFKHRISSVLSGHIFRK